MRFMLRRCSGRRRDLFCWIFIRETLRSQIDRRLRGESVRTIEFKMSNICQTDSKNGSLPVIEPRWRSKNEGGRSSRSYFQSGADHEYAFGSPGNAGLLKSWAAGLPRRT